MSCFVSCSVIIGAGSGAGTFVLLCIGAIIYCCYRQRTKPKTLRRSGISRTAAFRVAEKPDDRIISEPPKPDLTTVLVNDDDETGEGAAQVYPPVRSGSIVLPAVTRPPKLRRPRSEKLDLAIQEVEEERGEEEEKEKDVQLRPRTSSSSLAPHLGKRRPSSMTEYDPLHSPMCTKPSFLEDTGLDESSLTEVISSSKEESPLGQIQFKLEYNFSSRSVRVLLICACNLPPKDMSGTSDPFVKVLLVDTSAVTTTGKVPQNSPSWQCQRREKTLNPAWEEAHDFPCPPNVPLQRLGLLMLVYDYDRLSRNELIGHVWFTLRDADLSSSPMFWRSIQPGDRIGSEEVSAMKTVFTTLIL